MSRQVEHPFSDPTPRTGRGGRLLIAATFAAVAIASSTATATAAVLEVVSPNDSGAGTLRQAILDAKAGDEIKFDLGANKTIVLLSELPEITRSIDINGTSQPGWAGQPLIEINGQNVTGSGLRISANGCKVRGLVINRVAGSAIRLVGGDLNTVSGNYVGTDVTGQIALPNAQEGIRIDGAAIGNTIGGTTAAERNLISGNGTTGVLILGGSLNAVIGNYIGTNATGSAALGNGGYAVRASSGGNFIGTTQPGAGNLISGNARGVSVEGTGNAVYGNTIGLDAAETTKLANKQGGIWIHGTGCIIGSADPLGGNVVSGNDYSGIYVDPDASGCKIAGNRIGTNRAGTVALGNGSGVRIDGDGNTLGGTLAGEGNLISGNTASGVSLSGSGNALLGNTIGLDSSGTLKLPNASGVRIYGAQNTIGAPGAGNVISGNNEWGIVLYDGGASANVIQANKVGTQADGVSAAGNAFYGVQVHNAVENLIGGVDPGEGNVLAHNGYYGVFIDSGTGNAMLGNSIFSNGYWGIDLAPYGVAINDSGDVDFGPNHGQNYPVITGATVVGGSTTVAGILSSTPNASFTVEIFSSPDCDPSGFGEGRTFVGRFPVQTDAGGKASFQQVIPVKVADPFVTATATSATLDTSEFSPCALTTGSSPGVLQFSQPLFSGYENDPDGAVTVTVARSEGASGTVSVNYTTSPDGATSGQDYTETSGTLTFAPGEAAKSFAVPVVFDLVAEGQENIKLTLGAPTGGATLGASSTSKIVLIDYDASSPTAYVSDAGVVEGASGATAQMKFTVTVTPGNAPVTVIYGTTDGSAVAGEDYEQTKGQLVFNPGDAPKTVVVPVLGDDALEGNETFFLNIVNVLGGTLSDQIGEAVIYDDDAPGAAALCVGGATIAKPKLVLSGLGGAAGDERLKLVGKLEFAPGAPAGFTSLDALGRGAQILVEDLGAGGAVVFELSHRTTPVPPGARGPACVAGEIDGWLASANEKKYFYANESGALPDACTQGSARGLKLLRLLDRRLGLSQSVDFLIKTAATTIVQPVGPLRATIVLSADEADGLAGACGSQTFAALDCTLKGDGQRLVCK